MLSQTDNPTLLPRVSFILPTLNVEALLDNVLSSIARQTYPRDRYEILLADAHSTDRTREIAKKHGAIVLDDDGKNMEEGKRLALQHATGEFIVFVDADNEITHADYIELAVKALAVNPQALGVESYYLPSPKMSSFCAYLTHRLHISDPIAWLMSTNPKLVAREGEVERWILPGHSLSYPLGANGFVFRRADLESVKTGGYFQDTHAALRLMREGKREWLRIRGRGVHHYYVQTLWGFVQKRRRATVHFLRVQEAAKTNWMKEKPPVPLWLAGVYCVTFAGPLWHSLRGWFRDRDARWLWHVPASLGSVLGDAWGVWTYKTRHSDRNLVAKLKPKQTLKQMESHIENSGRLDGQPLVSIVVLNCNGANWLPKCFGAIKAQTILNQIETVLVDNNSNDDSVAVARRLLADFPCARIVRNSANLGFCEGNNSGAHAANGRYLFFLNNDTWLETDCLERLIAGTEKLGAVAATPYVLNYPDNSYQDFGFYGFDLFGLPSPSSPVTASREIFIPGGCSYLIRADVFNRVGMFDADFFIYSDDADLSWRLWIAGYKAAGVVPARVHHRGAAGVNPAGGIATVEFRTTDKKRFLTNRNCILTLLKNGQHILLLPIIPLIALLFLESLAGSLLLRRWSFVKTTFWDVLRDCWRLRGHIAQQRKMVATFRKHSDFWMLRFFRLNLNRWFEIKRLFQFGRPRVDV